MDIITVQKRDTTTKAKHLRRSGLVPSNIFGGMLQETISIQMDEVMARKLLRVKREGSKLRLALGDQVIPVQIKEKMQNTLSNEIVHISFQALKEDQKVNSVIHILLKNMDKVAGIVERIMPEVPYAALPADMIDTITIDLEGMLVGKVLTIRDIPEFQNEKIDLQIDTDSIVLRINDKTRAVVQTEDEV